jgi:hypothetical protein
MPTTLKLNTYSRAILKSAIGLSRKFGQRRRHFFYSLSVSLKI